jgi:hypothetical protein
MQYPWREMDLKLRRSDLDDTAGMSSEALGMSTESRGSASLGSEWT